MSSLRSLRLAAVQWLRNGVCRLITGFVAHVTRASSLTPCALSTACLLQLRLLYLLEKQLYAAPLFSRLGLFEAASGAPAWLT